MLIILLIVIYTYIILIQSIPDNIVIFEGESINLRTMLGLKASLTEQNQIIETLSSNQTKVIENSGKKTVKLSLFENVFLKDINIDVLPKTTVIPIGNIAGIKLYTSGVLVVGMTEIKGIDNKKYKPYENTGIKEGDTITQVNNKEIASTEELMQTVNQSQGKAVKIKYIQSEETKECSIYTWWKDIRMFDKTSPNC